MKKIVLEACPKKWRSYQKKCVLLFWCHKLSSPNRCRVFALSLTHIKVSRLKRARHRHWIRRHHFWENKSERISIFWPTFATAWGWKRISLPFRISNSPLCVYDMIRFSIFLSLTRFVYLSVCYSVLILCVKRISPPFRILNSPLCVYNLIRFLIFLSLTRFVSLSNC